MFFSERQTQYRKIKRHMKRIFVLFLAIGFAASAPELFAQNARERERGPRGDRGDTIEQRVERMATFLDLTEKQREELTNVLTAHRDQLSAAETREQRMELMRETREEHQKAVAEILTDEQRAKWREHLQGRRAEIRHRPGDRPQRGERTDRGGPPPRGERTDRGERPQRGEQVAPAETTERGERGERRIRRPRGAGPN